MNTLTHNRALSFVLLLFIFIGTKPTQAEQWEPVNSGLTNLAVESLAVDSEGRLFAGTWGGGLFRSVDRGGAWHSVSQGIPPRHIRQVEIDANDRIFIAAMGLDSGSRSELYRSENHGDTWTTLTLEASNQNFDVICMFINHSNELVLGTTMGNYFSSDHGDHWSIISDPPRLMSVMESSNDVMIGGAMLNLVEGGIFRSLDGGRTWTQVRVVTEQSSIDFLTEVPEGRIIAAGWFPPLFGEYISTDHGLNWVYAFPLPPGALLDVVRRPAGDYFVVGGYDFNWGQSLSNGVWRSYDGQGSWQDVTEGIREGPTSMSPCQAIVCLPDNTLFVATQDKGVFRSTWSVPVELSSFQEE